MGNVWPSSVVNRTRNFVRISQLVPFLHCLQISRSPSVTALSGAPWRLSAFFAGSRAEALSLVLIT